MKNFFDANQLIRGRRLKICWWPLDKRKKLYSSNARAWWHIDFLSKNFKDLEIKPYGEKGDILVLQKPLTFEICQKARRIFKNFSLVIFDLSDLVARIDQATSRKLNILTLEQFKEFSAAASFFVVNGIGLKKWVETELQKSAAIIEDPYHIGYNFSWVKRHQTTNPKVVWHGGGKPAALFVEGYLKGLSGALLEQSGHPEWYLGDLNDVFGLPITVFADFSYFKYRKSSKTIFKRHPQYPKIFRKLLDYDIGIAPYWLWDPDCLGKSTNKSDAMMLVGLPVIATPIPENKRLIENGVNGFLCSDKQEWQLAFEKLKDPLLRQQIGEQGRQAVIEKRSLPFLSSRWRFLFFASFFKNYRPNLDSFGPWLKN